MESKKIIVTGGAGYIGSHTVVELFNHGFEPIIVDNFSNSEKSVLAGLKEITGRNIKLFEGDCSDPNFINDIFKVERDVAGVIHFAAYKSVGESIKFPIKYYSNNLGSLCALLEAMEQHQVRYLVFSSSCTVYGAAKKLPVTENTPVVTPFSPYGNTKKISEEIISQEAQNRKQLKAISLRYFNPIGAHPSAVIGELPIGVPSNLVPYITQTVAGARNQLTVFGDDYNTPDGSCIRDYLHVVDLAKAHVKALDYLFDQQEDPYDVFNLGTGHGNSVFQIINEFEKVVGKKVNYVVGDRRTGDVPVMYANADKAHQFLDWRTELSLEDALADSWRWQEKISL